MAAPQQLALSTRMLNASLNDASPIESLPVELLLHIFEMCGTYINAQIKLTHICKCWRIISIRSPSLWTEVHIRASKEDTKERFNDLMCLLRLQLSRTGDLPLDVLWFSSCNESQNGRIMCLIREMAPFSRWRTLVVRVEDFHPHGPLAPQPTDVFTNLESLSVYWFTNFSIIDTISRTATSKLQTLDLRSCSPPPKGLSKVYGTLMKVASHLIMPSSSNAIPNIDIPPNVSHLEVDSRSRHIFPQITHYKLVVCAFATADTFLPNLTNLNVTSSLDVLSRCEVTLPSLKILRCATIRLDSNAALSAPRLETAHFCASYSSAVNERRVEAFEKTLQHPGYQLSPQRLLNIELYMSQKSVLRVLELSPRVSGVTLTFQNELSARRILDRAMSSISTTDGDAGGSHTPIGSQVNELRLNFKWPIQNLEFWKARASSWVAERRLTGCSLSIYASWKGEGTDILLA
jgi:hypothetical protein